MIAPVSNRTAWLRAVLILPAIVGGTSAIVAFAPGLAVAAGVSTANADLAIPAAIIALALIGAWLWRQPIRPGIDRDRLLLSALPFGLCGVVATLALAWAAGVVVPLEGEGVADGIGLFLLGSLLIIVAAAGEELLFRGLLQPVLCRAWGPVVGIVVSALAFALIHVIGGWRDSVSLMNIAIAGLWFGLLAWRTGGVLASILAHAGYNWTEEMLFGASPNPGTGAFGSLFDVDLVGPQIWGGSADGLNGSLLLTFVLAMIILTLLFWPPFRTIGPKRARS